MSRAAERIEQARRDVERARRNLASSKGALQHRLKPGNLASNAWDGVREKSGAMADDALQAVKDRPVAAAGIVSAIAIFLARDPLWRAAAGFLSRRDAQVEPGTIPADLDHPDKNYDLTAPTVRKRKKEGAHA